MKLSGKNVKGSYTVVALIVIPAILLVTLTICGTMRFIEKYNDAMTAMSAGSVEFNNYLSVFKTAGMAQASAAAPDGAPNASDSTLDEICTLADLSDIDLASYERFERNGASLDALNGSQAESAEIKRRVAKISEYMKGFNKSDMKMLIARAYQKSYEHAAENFVSKDVTVKILAENFEYDKQSGGLHITVKIHIPVFWKLGIEEKVISEVMDMGILL